LVDLFISAYIVWAISTPAPHPLPLPLTPLKHCFLTADLALYLAGLLAIIGDHMLLDVVVHGMTSESHCYESKLVHSLL
jgi:hypothetical protein